MKNQVSCLMLEFKGTGLLPKSFIPNLKLLAFIDAIIVKQLGCQPIQKKILNKVVKSASDIFMRLICGSTNIKNQTQKRNLFTTTRHLT